MTTERLKQNETKRSGPIWSYSYDAGKVCFAFETIQLDRMRLLRLAKHFCTFTLDVQNKSSKKTRLSTDDNLYDDVLINEIRGSLAKVSSFHSDKMIFLHWYAVDSLWLRMRLPWMSDSVGWTSEYSTLCQGPNAHTALHVFRLCSSDRMAAKEENCSSPIELCCSAEAKIYK